MGVRDLFLTDAVTFLCGVSAGILHGLGYDYFPVDLSDMTYVFNLVGFGTLGFMSGISYSPRNFGPQEYKKNLTRGVIFSVLFSTLSYIKTRLEVGMSYPVGVAIGTILRGSSLY